MALQKQQVTVNFDQGINTKVDPWQLPVGQFLNLENSIFTKQGLLQKRNGFKEIARLSDTSVTSITTFNGNLTAVGNNIYAYSSATNDFINKGTFKKASLGTQTLIKNNLNQIQCDAAVASNNLVCVVYTESNSGNAYKYAVFDSSTGQNVIPPADIVPTSGTVSGSPRVFAIQDYFIILYTATIGITTRLQYVPIGYNSLVVGSAVDITNVYTSASTVAFDGCVFNGYLYFAWNKNVAGVYAAYLTPSLQLSAAKTIDSAHNCTHVTLCADLNTVYVSYYNYATKNGYSVGLDVNLNIVYGPVQWIAGQDLVNITSSAITGTCTIIYEYENYYAYNTDLQTDYIAKKTCTNLGIVGSESIVARSVGLASKSFVIDGTIYFSSTYTCYNTATSEVQSIEPSYFVLDSNGNVISKLAFQNANNYLTLGLPQVSVVGSLAKFPYLYRNVVQSVNKGTDLSAGTQIAQIYSQTGINLASLTLSYGVANTTEIGKNLLLSGGFLWGYDGSSAVENGFFLYPENIEATWSATGGNIAAQPDGITNANAYYYQVTYEWSDNQGNIFKSAPSVPVSVTTTGSGTTGSIVINVPTLRLSYKTNVKIVVYRWSIAQQSYYQVTSITSPEINDPTVDEIAITDTLSDASILGNNLIYTTGGVLENIGGPACSAITLFDNRVWAVDSENKNLLWFSKQVIQSTPVEMSDLLTIYVSPTQSAQGNTGDIKCLAPMDDKLIIFKEDAIYYLNGVGPDNTGANSQYSEPIFITSTVGCSNPKSIVFIPNGLMFQSDKGIWLLGRDLSTNYIGSPVEDYTQNDLVNSAVNVPETNQVRFMMSGGLNSKTLMYDYFYNQWGTFTGIPGFSSTLYSGLHTYLDTRTSTSGVTQFRVHQETPGVYLDGDNPTLMSFTTSWFALAGILGFQRAYFLFFLGKYYSPHKLVVDVAYDFNPNYVQQVVITPNNYSDSYGEDYVYGQNESFGGMEQVEKWRIMLQRQKCDSVLFRFTEQFDPTIGAPAGAGFTMSGLNFIVGIKRVFNTFPASLTAG